MLNNSNKYAENTSCVLGENFSYSTGFISWNPKYERKDAFISFIFTHGELRLKSVEKVVQSHSEQRFELWQPSFPAAIWCVGWLQQE